MVGIKGSVGYLHNIVGGHAKNRAYYNLKVQVVTLKYEMIEFVAIL